MMLETERLTLRPLEAGDLANIHAMMGDPEVMAFWDVEAINDPSLTRIILEGQLNDMALGRALYWAMIADDSGGFAGCCDLSEIDLWHRRAEIGFMLLRPFWGGGYAFEAMSAVIRHSFEGLRLRRLSARVHLGNDRSVRLLHRLGFAEEGVLRGYVARGDERRDCRMFGLLA
jgi:ribosomal-protein-alanine N-acetyltransferase